MHRANGRKIFIYFAAFYFLSLSPADAGYFEEMGKHLRRGAANFFSSPLEIPIAIQDRHESAGYPLARHIFGFFEGSYRMLMRAGSGLLDLGIAFLPGEHKGITPDPETLL